MNKNKLNKTYENYRDIKRLMSNFREEKRNKKINNRRIARMFAFLLLILIFLVVWNHANTNKIEKYGLETRALLNETNHQSFILNQMDGTSVNTYFFKYEFEYQNQTYFGIDEIPAHLIHDYFDELPGDRTHIMIQFMPDDPEKNQIKKLATID